MEGKGGALMQENLIKKKASNFNDFSRKWVSYNR